MQRLLRYSESKVDEITADNVQDQTQQAAVTVSQQQPQQAAVTVPCDSLKLVHTAHSYTL